MIRKSVPWLVLSVVLNASLPSDSAEVGDDWNQLTIVPLFLEATLAQIELYPLPSPVPRWTIRAEERPRLKEYLESFGLPSELTAYLADPANQVEEGAWLHLFPPIDNVVELSPTVRARFYAELARYQPNEYQRDPVLITSDTVEEWYVDSDLRPALVDQISALSYRRGIAWAFSDLALMLNFAQSEGEARALFKAFTRVRTYLAKLKVTDDSNIEKLRDYWTVGTGFRQKDIDPLLQSLKEQTGVVELDLVHLLPPLARRLLYTYPRAELAAKGILPDCHWTSLNFFNYEPHDSYLDARLATNRVLENFVVVEPPYQYGDILFFVDETEGMAYHSCVYLAGDLVYTKNGRNRLSPWVISTVEDVRRIYLAMSSGVVRGYRRRLGATD